MLDHENLGVTLKKKSQKNSENVSKKKTNSVALRVVASDDKVP